MDFFTRQNLTTLLRAYYRYVQDRFPNEGFTPLLCEETLRGVRAECLVCHSARF